MEKFPESGTEIAAGATFRLISISSAKENVEQKIMLEPYNLPGTLLMHQGKGKSLTVAADSEAGESSVFHIIPGLDGNKGTVSLESVNQKGCYVYSDLGEMKMSGASIKLGCNAALSNDEFKQATSFKLEDGINKYHPISFVVKGKQRNFLLSPLLGMKDESYTVYFNLS